MFTPEPNSNYKLWKIHPKKKKILREIVDQNIKIISESVTEDLLSKDYSFLKKDFDSELIKTFLKYNLINYIYPTVINLSKDEKFKLRKYKSNFFKKNIKFNFKFFIKIFYTILKQFFF